jgi:hypothetical protein
MSVRDFFFEEIKQLSTLTYAETHHGPVHLAYNPSYSACFFSRNSIFLSQKISQ